MKHNQKFAMTLLYVLKIGNLDALGIFETNTSNVAYSRVFVIQRLVNDPTKYIFYRETL
jgi:hypothetical protein